VTCRVPLLLGLLLSACSTPGDPPSGEAARKESWEGKAAGIQADWDRGRLETYLEGIRVRVRRPFRSYQGTIRKGAEPGKHYNRYVLDEDFELFVTWKEEGRLPVLAEVVGLWDLKGRLDRVDPAFYPALQQVHRAPTAEDLWDYDPIRLIRAVNAVRALGEKAAAALAAYEGLSRDLSSEEVPKYGVNPSRVLAVAWLVFARPPLQRASIVQLPEELPVPDAKAWPLFPFTLEQGLPFLVNSFSGGSLDLKKPGIADRRAAPLEPALDPVEAVEQLLASPRWEALLTATDRVRAPLTRKEGTQLKFLVREQALQALASVYTPPPDEPPKDCCRDPQEVRWARIVEEVRALRLRWDPRRQDFVPSR